MSKSKVPTLAKKPTREELAKLDEFLPEAHLGIPLRWIQKQTKLPLSTIRYWRVLRGIRARPMEARRASQEAAKALDLVGALDGREEAFMHLLEGSPVRGQFEVPYFMLRVPIRYSLFAKMVHALYRQGFGKEAIAIGFGFRLKDIESALLLMERSNGEA